MEIRSAWPFNAIPATVIRGVFLFIYVFNLNIILYGILLYLFLIFIMITFIYTLFMWQIDTYIHSKVCTQATFQTPGFF